MSDVTHILSQIDAGESTAEQLLPLVYDELRRLAAVRLANEKPGQTLQATALVHEAYVRLVGGDSLRDFNGRTHFFAAAAEAMRRILVDNARRKKTDKFGGNLQRRDIEGVSLVANEPNVDVLALHEAIQRLEELDARKATLVKLRYFAGMTFDEAAQALGVSKSTAEKEFAYARAWLQVEMSPASED
jgi:RNA polymerase sigma factor (TIGR02999 family)